MVIYSMGVGLSLRELLVVVGGCFTGILGFIILQQGTPGLFVGGETSRLGVGGPLDVHDCCLAQGS